MHHQATGLKPNNDYDLSRKVEFMKRIRNTQIANKIIKSNRFKDYTRYSLQACFARALELEGDYQVGEVVTPSYTQAQVLAVEGDPSPEVAAGDVGGEVVPVDKQGTATSGMYNPNVCWRCGQVGHFARDCPNQDPQPTWALGKLHHSLEAEMPITRSLLNEFFNKLMRSERKQEITKAKLKRVRQQLNAPTGAGQVGVGTTPVTPAKLTPAQAGSPTVTPPPANVPRKAQVGRPAKVARPKAPPQTPALGPKKPPPPKPPVTRSQTKKQTITKTIAVTDPEGDTAVSGDVEYETDELAELPTDSEPELVESESGEEVVQTEEQ